MVVKARSPAPRLDLGYLALLLGLRVNQVVMERMRAAGFQNVRESHGYLIQHLIESDRSITELARRMEVTQQAASKVTAELAQLGVLEITPGHDRRAKRVRLSEKGWRLVRLGRKVRAQIEKRLIRTAGKERYKTASDILSVCLESLGGMERIRTRRVPPPQ